MLPIGSEDMIRLLLCYEHLRIQNSTMETADWGNNEYQGELLEVPNTISGMLYTLPTSDS